MRTIGALIFASALATPALGTPPVGMTVVATLDVARGKEVDTTVNLPAGTAALNFEVQGGSFTCQSVKVIFADGTTDNVFSRSPMLDKAHMKFAIGPKQTQKTYISVTVKCTAGDGLGGKLVIAAGKS